MKLLKLRVTPGRPSEVVAKARAGARVVVRSGTYAESLSVDRPLSIVAADSAAPPVIAPVRSPCAILDSDGVELAHFVLRAPATLMAPLIKDLDDAGVPLPNPEPCSRSPHGGP